MTDYITIGPSPSAEDCAQVGAADYPEASRKECKRYIEQLLRVYGPPPEGAQLLVKSFPHDFGTYREVVCKYDTENEEAVDYAMRVENGCENWDEVPATTKEGN
jgi:hypothetical protein